MNAARVARVVREGADPICLSTLQPGLRYFERPEGFVAYQRAFGVALSLGGPVCAAADEVGLASRFLEEVPGAALFYVNDRIASRAEGLRASLGADRVLELGRAGAFEAPPVRSAIRKAEKARFELEELPAAPAGADLAFLERVTAASLQRSAVPREMRFLNRPLASAPGLARTFALALKGRRFGYAVADPYVDSGQVKGYLLNLIRFEPTSLWGVYLATVHALAQRFADEGARELSLGFCPFAEVDLPGSSTRVRGQLAFAARQWRGIEYFSRLHQMKGLFGGRWDRRWLVTGTPQLLTPLLAFLKLMGVPWRHLVREQLARLLPN